MFDGPSLFGIELFQIGQWGVDCESADEAGGPNEPHFSFCSQYLGRIQIASCVVAAKMSPEEQDSSLRSPMCAKR
jgi:hypothetical protein